MFIFNKVTNTKYIFKKMSKVENVKINSFISTFFIIKQKKKIAHHLVSSNI